RASRRELRDTSAPKRPRDISTIELASSHQNHLVVSLMDSPQKPRVCISLCEPTVAALEQAITAAAEVCDLIEVRLDGLNPYELENDSAAITELLQQATCDSILTFRPSQEGGRRVLDDATRQSFWSDAIFSASFFD